MVKMNKENLQSVLPAAVAASTELTNAQKRVLGQLIVYSGLEEAKNNDGWFYRSNEDLCSDVDVSNNTLLSAVRKLYDFGYIDRRAGSRTTGASEYKVLMDCTQIEPLTAPIAPINCTLNCTNTLDDIYLVMSDILTELKHIGSIIGSVDCTHNCGDKGAKAQVNSAIEPIEPSNCTPDTDTDITNKSTTNETNSSTYSKCTDSESEVTSSDSDDVCFSSHPNNRKFEEQLNRIHKAIFNVRTDNSPENINTMQRVVDDAAAKARMYATDKQQNLIDCRLSDFQKYAYGYQASMEKWIEDLPDFLDVFQADAAMIMYFQAVDDELSKIPEQDKRSLCSDICLQKAVHTYTRPYAELRGYDLEKASGIITANYHKNVTTQIT